MFICEHTNVMLDNCDSSIRSALNPTAFAKLTFDIMTDASKYDNADNAFYNNNCANGRWYQFVADFLLEPLLLTWFYFNPSMDKQLHPL